MDERSLGERIRMARRFAGLTQEVVASEFGCTQSLVSAMEKGASQPTVAFLRWLSGRTGVKGGWILAAEGYGPGEEDAAGFVADTTNIGNRPIDESKVADVMTLLDQLEEFFEEKLSPQKKAQIFTRIYTDKLAGKPIRLIDFADMLKTG